MKAEEQTADVGNGRRRLRALLAGLRNHHARERVVRRHAERNEIGRAADLAERRIAGVERVGLPVGLLEPRCRAGQVGEEQRVGFHQHGFAFRVRLRRNRGGREQAVGKGVGHGARFRRSGLRRVFDVARDHLHVAADLAEDHDRGPAEAPRQAAGHRTGQEAVLAQPLVEVGRKEIVVVELIGRDLQPHLLVLLPEAEQPGQLLRVAADFGESLQRARRRRRGRRRVAARRARQPLRIGDGLRRDRRGCRDDRFLGRRVLQGRAPGKRAGAGKRGDAVNSNANHAHAPAPASIVAATSLVAAC